MVPIGERVEVVLIVEIMEELVSVSVVVERLELNPLLVVSDVTLSEELGMRLLSAVIEVIVLKAVLRVVDLVDIPGSDVVVMLDRVELEDSR